jgi:hypothetical protein
MSVIKQQTKSVFSMSCIELIIYLQKELGDLKFSDYIVKRFIEEQIDGESFLLMKKENFIEMNIMDKYNILCLIFPSALFADEYI